MFTRKHYVPILKCKKGEFDALHDITAASRANLTPLYQVSVLSDDDDIDSHLNSLVDNIIYSWPVFQDRPVFIDFLNIDDDVRMVNGVHFLVRIFDEARQKGLRLIPITNTSHDQNFQNEVRDIHLQDRNGICLRFDVQTIVAPNFVNDLHALLMQLGVSATECDFIIDAGYTADAQVTSNIFIIETLLNTLPMIADWRTLTIANTSFPVDLSNIPNHNITILDRNEWRIWLYLVNRFVRDNKVYARLPSFGDYAISNPDSLDTFLPYMKPNASIRYSIIDSWMIVKGANLFTSPQRFGEFRTISNALILRTEYLGRAFSWGDNFIYECANGIGGTGNLSTWRKVGTNHHLTLVTHQISSLNGI